MMVAEKCARIVMTRSSRTAFSTYNTEVTDRTMFVIVCPYRFVPVFALLNWVLTIFLFRLLLLLFVLLAKIAQCGVFC